MASRCLILLTLVACAFIASCDDLPDDSDDTELFSEAEIYSPPDEESAWAEPSTKCKKVKNCKKYEEFSYCTQDIGRAQYCSQKGLALAPRGDSPCNEGCVCEEGYLRNVNGTCIPVRKCQADCAPNEVLDKCPVDCASDYCPTSEEDSILTCLKSDQDECPDPVCKCGFNQRRADNGTCIPTRSCPSFDCSERPNEEYKSCSPLCSDSCSQATPSGECKRSTFGHILIVLICKPECRCIDGYWRKDGVCVPYRECPNICPPNEQYSECTQTICKPQNCTEMGQKKIHCPLVLDKDCNQGCICKSGFLRNNNGICIPEDKCAYTCPDPNEEYTLSRTPNCPALGTCTSILARIACEEPEVLGCTCRGGYLRHDETSPCIPTCECPQMKNEPQCKKNVTICPQ